MNSISKIAFALLAGILSYGIYFGYIFHRPLTIDLGEEMLEKKIEFLRSIKDKNKIIILAGSNGRFSHSCEVVERLTNIACVNVSISADVGIKYLFYKMRDHLIEGDLVYMPLEYRNHQRINEDNVSGEALMAFYHDKSTLFKLYTPNGLIRTYFLFDIRFLLSSVGEMLMKFNGVQRRFSLNSINNYGDEIGHESYSGRSYKNYIKQIGPIEIDVESYRNEKYWKDINEVVMGLIEKKIKVIGGLPTTFTDTNIQPEVIQYLQSFYLTRGACFFSLKNNSLYPRESFFDTYYHLNLEGQQLHSENLSPILKKYFNEEGCR